MADNINVTPGTGATVAADEISGVLYQRVKPVIGGDGSATDLTYGQAVKANSLPVTLASDQGTIAARGTFTDRSGATITGNTSQQIAAANSARQYLIIVNTGVDTLWVDFGTAAVIGQPSIPLQAASVNGGDDGGSLVFEGTFVPTASVNVIGTNSGRPYVAKEG